VDLRDPNRNYNKFAATDVVAKHPAISWNKYFAARGLVAGAANGKASPTPIAGLVEVPYVIVGQPEFFDEVDRLVKERPLSDWQVYLRWHLLHASAPYLHAAVETENFNFFSRTLTGQQEQEPRWKRASRVIDGSIGEALGQLYVEKYFPPEARVRMND